MSTSTPADKPRLTEEEKKSNHIASEQKRRQAIRQGFDRLASIVPGMEGQGRSEAIVLEATVKYLKEQYTLQQKLVAQIKARGIDLADLELPEGYLEAIENPVAQDLLAAEDESGERLNGDDKLPPGTAAKRRRSRSVFSVVPAGKDFFQECRDKVLFRVQKQAPKMHLNNRPSSHSHPTTASDVIRLASDFAGDSGPPKTLSRGVVSKSNLTSSSGDKRPTESALVSELDQYAQQLVGHSLDNRVIKDTMPEPIGEFQLSASDLPTVQPSLPQARISVDTMFQNLIVSSSVMPGGFENVVSFLSKLSIISKTIYSTLDPNRDAGLAMEVDFCGHPRALSDLKEMRGHVAQIATSLQDLEKLWWELEKKGNCTRQLRERISFLTSQAIEKNWPISKENRAVRPQDGAQFGDIPNVVNDEVSAVSLGTLGGVPTIRAVPPSDGEGDALVGTGSFDIRGSLAIRTPPFAGDCDPFVSSGPFDTSGSLVYFRGSRNTQNSDISALRGPEYGGSNFMAKSFGRSGPNLLSDFLHSDNVWTEMPAEVPRSEHASADQANRSEGLAQKNGALAPKRQPRSKKTVNSKTTSATTPACSANRKKTGSGRGQRPARKMSSKQTQSLTAAGNDTALKTEQQPSASSQDAVNSSLRRSARIRDLSASNNSSSLVDPGSTSAKSNSTITTSGTVRKRAAMQSPSTRGNANKRGRTRRTSSMNNTGEASDMHDTYGAGGYTSFGRANNFNNTQGTGNAEVFGRSNIGSNLESSNSPNSFSDLGGPIMFPGMNSPSTNNFNGRSISPFEPPRPSSPRSTLEAYARMQAARQVVETQRSTVYDAEGNSLSWNKVLPTEEMKNMKGLLSWSEDGNDSASPGT